MTGHIMNNWVQAQKLTHCRLAIDLLSLSLLRFIWGIQNRPLIILTTVIMKLVTNLAGILILIFKSGFFIWCEVVHCMISGWHFPVKTLASPLNRNLKWLVATPTDNKSMFILSVLQFTFSVNTTKIHAIKSAWF